MYHRAKIHFKYVYLILYRAAKRQPPYRTYAARVLWRVADGEKDMW